MKGMMFTGSNPGFLYEIIPAYMRFGWGGRTSNDRLPIIEVSYGLSELQFLTTIARVVQERSAKPAVYVWDGKGVELEAMVVFEVAQSTPKERERIIGNPLFREMAAKASLRRLLAISSANIPRDSFAQFMDLFKGVKKALLLVTEASRHSVKEGVAADPLITFEISEVHQQRPDLKIL